MSLSTRPATEADLQTISLIIKANQADPSLFQQSSRQLRAALGEFLVTVDGDAIVGCIQVHRHWLGSVEILAVAVHPDQHGRGVGTAMMRAAMARARSMTRGRIWLGTAKPGYFARHGFGPFSRWRLPLPILIGKLLLVFHQPAARWLPAIFGRHVFMSLPSARGQ